ncbi:hypothetical protein IFM89_019606 [Coptis chinensis]|uniref:DNA-directed RNA polymerase n=1 Tax=Coptis chinensis TaxID=261450 RepID=A0A835ID08_9MAGN|nr:hypothetical protein IFM89_019606 [Coptis chinensis]
MGRYEVWNMGAMEILLLSLRRKIRWLHRDGLKGNAKFGEMERDCLLAPGAAANLHERLFTLSDFSHMHICGKCLHISNVIQRSVACGGKIRRPFCRFCDSAEHVVKVNVPYEVKLLCQELFIMGISVKFGTEPC